MPLNPVRLPILAGQQTDSQTDYVDRLPLNMYAVAKSVRGDSSYLISQDGLKLRDTVTRPTALGDRGAIYNDKQGVHLRLIGDALVSVSTGGIVTVGTIFGTKQASTAYSENSTLFVCDNQAYRVLPDFTISQYLPTTTYPYFLDGVYIGGYYVFTDGRKIFHTKISNEAIIEGDANNEASLSPDPTVALLTTQDGLLMALGRYSIQYFYNAGTVPFSFQLLPAKSILAGVVGTHAKTQLLGDVFILGGRRNESPSFYIIAPGDIKPVSTRTVDKILSTYTAEQLSEVVLESRMDNGTALMIARLPNHTLCFNWTFAQAAGLENAWSVMSTGTMEMPWIGRNGVFDPAIRKWIYGSSSTGKIYELDRESAAQDGEPTEFEFQTPIVPFRGKLPKIEIDSISGIGSGAKSVFISVSTNAAFFNTEWVQAMPSQASYGRKYIANRIGYYPNDFIVRVRGVSVDKFNFSGMTAYVAA